jgi:apolipoprotein N-acyltransferase
MTPPWYRTTWFLGLLGSLLMWLALPPADLWPLAWIAPLPWLLLIRQPALPGRRPLLTLWLCGFAFWLAALYWLTLPHWATSFGWLALSFYLAFYIPVFIGATRAVVHGTGLSIVLAAPVVWTGLALAKGHLLSGFTMGSLEHTQFRWLQLIQVADLVGGYGVGFIVMFIAACLARMCPWNTNRWSLWPAAAAAALLAATLSYGTLRMQGDYERPGPTIALVQGSVDARLKAEPELNEPILREHMGLSADAVAQNKDVDLIVWPETMFRYPLVAFSDDFQLPSYARGTKEQMAAQSLENLALLVREPPFEGRYPFLLGIDRVHFSPGREDHFNSAVFVDRDGRVLGHYDKMHLVMFGEYVPFADMIPWLYQLTPLAGGVRWGERPVTFLVGKEGAQARIAPNICYETVIPHLIRRHVIELRGRGEEPDVLVNLTNDGWFYGSSELDMHLACGVFRAVECRKPLLVSANTGFSAWIDGDGLVHARGPRRAQGVIIAPVRLDGRHSWYLEYGDLPAGICLILGGALALIGRRKQSAAGDRPATAP